MQVRGLGQLQERGQRLGDDFRNRGVLVVEGLDDVLLLEDAVVGHLRQACQNSINPPFCGLGSCMLGLRLRCQTRLGYGPRLDAIAACVRTTVMVRFAIGSKRSSRKVAPSNAATACPIAPRIAFTTHVHAIRHLSCTHNIQSRATLSPHKTCRAPHAQQEKKEGNRLPHTNACMDLGPGRNSIWNRPRRAKRNRDTIGAHRRRHRGDFRLLLGALRGRALALGRLGRRGLGRVCEDLDAKLGQDNALQPRVRTGRVSLLAQPARSRKRCGTAEQCNERNTVSDDNERATDKDDFDHGEGPVSAETTAQVRDNTRQKHVEQRARKASDVSIHPNRQ